MEPEEIYSFYAIILLLLFDNNSLQPDSCTMQYATKSVIEMKVRCVQFYNSLCF